MRPLATLLRHLPLGQADAVPPTPPLPDPATFSTWLDELAGQRSGWAWSLAGDVPRALGARLADGELPAEGEPAAEYDRCLPGEALDGFAGRVAGPPGRTPSERILQVAAWARALSEELATRPAWRVHEVRDGVRSSWAELPTRLGAPHVGILDGESLWVAEAPAGRPLTELATAIGEALSRRAFVPIAQQPVQALAAVVPLDRRPIHDARHAHRTAGLTGPWLVMGIGNRAHQAPPMELVAAPRTRIGPRDLAECMRRLHARADALLAALDEDAPRAIARDLTRRFGDLWRPRVSWRRPPRTEGREEYVARSLPAAELPEGGRDALIYRLASALHRLDGRGDTSPSVLVSLGARRVLTSVRFDGPRAEDLGAWADRFALQKGREADGYGLRSEWERRLARQPIAPTAHRRLLDAVRAAARVDGPASALTGTGVVHLSDLDPGDDAVFSGATPPGDRRHDAVVLHVHRVGERADVVLTARGRWAERSMAARLLDLILD